MDRIFLDKRMNSIIEAAQPGARRTVAAAAGPQTLHLMTAADRGALGRVRRAPARKRRSSTCPAGSP